jgi:hypothetical protein
MEIDTYPKGMVGQSVTLVGTARNAVLGALVVLSDNSTVYVDGLESWDKATDRKKIKVTGTLRKKKLAPDPVTNEKGEHSHGMVGSSMVIEDAKWEIA